MMGGIAVFIVFGLLQIILVNIYAHVQMHMCQLTCEHINLHMHICICKDKSHTYINTHAIFLMYMNVYKMHKCTCQYSSIRYANKHCFTAMKKV